MKITVCELPNEATDFSDAWNRLADHVLEKRSELVLLPEMPFYRWLAQTPEVDPDEWHRAVTVHEEWIDRLDQFAPATVLSSRPVVDDGVP